MWKSLFATFSWNTIRSKTFWTRVWCRRLTLWTSMRNLFESSTFHQSLGIIYVFWLCLESPVKGVSTCFNVFGYVYGSPQNKSGPDLPSKNKLEGGENWLSRNTILYVPLRFDERVKHIQPKIESKRTKRWENIKSKQTCPNMSSRATDETYSRNVWNVFSSAPIKMAQ